MTINSKPARTRAEAERALIELFGVDVLHVVDQARDEHAHTLSYDYSTLLSVLGTRQQSYDIAASHRSGQLLDRDVHAELVGEYRIWLLVHAMLVEDEKQR